MSKPQQLLLWLSEIRYFWLCAIIVGIALLVSLCLYPTEPCIRLTGSALQLLGVMTVAWGISQTRQLFGHPSFVGRLAKWISRFPLRKRNTTIFGSGVSSVSIATMGRAHITHPVGTSPSLEQLATALSENVRLINDRVSAIESEVDKERDTRAAELRTERNAREAADASIQARLEATGTGGVHISAIGATWIFVGVVLGSASPELARWFQ